MGSRILELNRPASRGFRTRDTFPPTIAIAPSEKGDGNLTD